MKSGRMFFLDVPLMDIPQAESARPVHYGAGNYVSTVTETEKTDYTNYLLLLETQGFVRFADNREGLDEVVFCATYTKENIVVTVAYYALQKETSISVCLDMPLSEHLIDKKEYMRENRKDAKTTMHMPELWSFGNSFLFQLKNGHFIISDGGMEEDFPYLLDYLESLVPEGEKPIVEAWIFTHGHRDHSGIMAGFLNDKSHASRLYVEGIYYNEPNERVCGMDAGANVAISYIKAASRVLRTSTGAPPLIYRPQTGQRYFFHDVTMEIVFAQEQLPREKYDGDFNDSSTWCMFCVEGQKCLISGDGQMGSMKFIMSHYTQRYLDIDMLTLMHHGYNTSNEFTDFCKVKTVLLTTHSDLPVRRARENAYLLQAAAESMAWGNGTKVMAFPYEIGSYQTLPKREWIYHLDQERVEVSSVVYEFPAKSHMFGWVILDADSIFCDTLSLRPGTKELLAYLKKRFVRIGLISDWNQEQTIAYIKHAGVLDYFEVVVGYDRVEHAKPEPDIFLRAASELEVVYKNLLYIGTRNADIMTANEAGIRCVLLTESIEAEEAIKMRTWAIKKNFEDVISLFQQLDS